MDSFVSRIAKTCIVRFDHDDTVAQARAAALRAIVELSWVRREMGKA
jgi:hypothetical protein